MSPTRSERVISALRQLQQFLPVRYEDVFVGAIHIHSGVRVLPVPDIDEEEHGLLELTFPGGVPFEVVGEMYLEQQIIEDARWVTDGHEDGAGKVASRGASTSEHLRRKHDLE